MGGTKEQQRTKNDKDNHDDDYHGDNDTDRDAKRSSTTSIKRKRSAGLPTSSSSSDGDSAAIGPRDETLREEEGARRLRTWILSREPQQYPSGRRSGALLGRGRLA